MPDKRTHRGPAPEDEHLFAAARLPALREATTDLCWLLDRGYALRSATELVGNRYSLTVRQRQAVSRCVCTAEAGVRRCEHRVPLVQLRDEELWLDGFNVLTGIEAALAGGVLLVGCDGCLRDLASVYARHHEVLETLPSLRLIGETLGAAGVSRCCWLLDRPVSNSGRLKQQILALGAANAWNWEVNLVFNPDKLLAESASIIATSDSVILDRCQRWTNLVRHIVTEHIPESWVVDFSTPTAG